MLQRSFSCVICGSIIDYWGDNIDPVSDVDDVEYYPPPSWRTQFRLVYTHPHGISVTGVGLNQYDYPTYWTAPRNFNDRWDDDGYGFPYRDSIGVLQQHPVNGSYGFPIHEACWSLLEVAYAPQPVPYERLFEVCRSLPLPVESYAFSWGHTYGGLTRINNEEYYPWENRFSDPQWTAQCQDASYDPYNIPEIQALLSEEAEDFRIEEPTHAHTIVPNRFPTLPAELSIQIACYLLTADALNARRALRSFVPIFYSTQFWASRFRTVADRSWIFESRQWNNTTDWRSIYRRTNKASRNKGMQNRERIWKLIRQVQQTLVGQWNDKPLLHSPQMDTTTLAWVEAAAYVRPVSLDVFHEGCRKFHEQETAVPAVLSKISFSIICIGGVEYIAGIRLTSQTGEVAQLGYRVTGQELTLDTVSLEGFNLAVGSRGIQGIQCMVEGGRLSPWFGSTVEAPQTRRLAVSNPIACLKAGFDGMKMVSLAIAECNPPAPQKDTEHSLCDFAFWYPQLPSRDLHLNGKYFPPRDNATANYLPLYWTLFAGHKGQYLKHLTGISVTSFGPPSRIDFQFDTEDVPTTNHKTDKWKRCTGSRVKHFEIDGPGGEFITGVEFYTKILGDDDGLPRLYRYGILQSFKIWTNRGRSCDFRHDVPRPDNEPGSDVNIVRTVVNIAPGSVITGFYWSQCNNDLLALGVISEDIEMPTTTNTSAVTALQ